MREAQASAPGKVNMLLRVGAPEKDGYHPLISVFEALDLRETVTVTTARTPGIAVSTTVYTPEGEVDGQASAMMNELDPHRHLAARAARTLQRLAQSGPWASTAAGVRIHVDKRVPIAGGMAGGSADAAAALVACNELWELGLDADQLQAVGRTLGADVPACLVGGIALGTGHGDHMQVLDSEHEHLWVCATAHEGLSTPEVFRRRDEMGEWAELTRPDEQTLAALTASAREAAPYLHNDLAAAAFTLRPELADTIEIGRESGALAVILSGSGPTVAALVADERAADSVAAAWREADQVDRVITTRGPAHGSVASAN